MCGILEIMMAVLIGMIILLVVGFSALTWWAIVTENNDG
jgi:Tfp pilus assembly protein PilW